MHCDKPSQALRHLGAATTPALPPSPQWGANGFGKMAGYWVGKALSKMGWMGGGAGWSSLFFVLTKSCVT